MEICLIFADMIIFGGTNGNTIFNDLHKYSPTNNQWAPITALGNDPPAVAFHTAVFYNNAMYVWGGCTSNCGNISQSTATSQLWKLDFSGSINPTWSQVFGSTPPSARFHHTATLVNDGMYIIGGVSKTAEFKDIKMYNIR